MLYILYTILNTFSLSLLVELIISSIWTYFILKVYLKSQSVFLKFCFVLGTYRGIPELIWCCWRHRTHNKKDKGEKESLQVHHSTNFFIHSLWKRLKWKISNTDFFFQKKTLLAVSCAIIVPKKRNNIGSILIARLNPWLLWKQSTCIYSYGWLTLSWQGFKQCCALFCPICI